MPTHVGRYEIRELLGSGSCATVYRAFDPDLEREVALKVPHPGSLSSLKAQARFIGEAKALAMLRHPGIISFLEAGQYGGVPSIATAYIAGKTLDDLTAEGPIPFARVVKWESGWRRLSITPMHLGWFTETSSPRMF